MSGSLIIIYRNYRLEWLRLRDEKEKAVQTEAQSRLKCALKEEGLGQAVPLVTELSTGRELADIYLKHPANESSDDSDGEEAPYTPADDRGNACIHTTMKVQLTTIENNKDWKIQNRTLSKIFNLRS